MLKNFFGSKKILLGVKNFLRSKKPVFRSKKSKNRVIGLKNQVIDVKSQKIIDLRRLFKYTRKKNEVDQKKGQQKNLGENTVIFRNFCRYREL